MIYIAGSWKLACVLCGVWKWKRRVSLSLSSDLFKANDNILEGPMSTTSLKPKRATKYSQRLLLLGLIVAIIYVIVSILLVQLLQYHTTFQPKLPLNRNSSGSQNGNLVLETEQNGETVVAIAMGYSLATYQMFVGSLRYSGFRGNILIGLQKDAPLEIVSYLISQGCVIRYVSLVACEPNKSSFGKCVASYPDVNRIWLRFRLAIDWLDSCDTCVGPVLFTDALNTFFQEDPFRTRISISRGLVLFEEGNPILENTIVYSLLSKCKSFKWNVAFISLGMIIGEKDILITYLDSLIREVRIWGKERLCNSDQVASVLAAAHNYLFYDGRVQASVLSAENELAIAVNENTLRDQSGFFVSNAGNKVPVIRNYTKRDDWVSRFPFITASNDTKYLASSDSSIYREINGDLL